jgi:hypothetical protein
MSAWTVYVRCKTSNPFEFRVFYIHNQRGRIHPIIPLRYPAGPVSLLMPKMMTFLLTLAVRLYRELPFHLMSFWFFLNCLGGSRDVDPWMDLSRCPLMLAYLTVYG